MESKIIVLIVMLAQPSGESGVHVKPYPTAAACMEAADIEAADPFVRHVECSQLDDGLLTLKFERADGTGQPRGAAAGGRAG